MDGFYSEAELKEIGLKEYGKNVLISKKACLYDAGKISVGSNVRIDDFSMLIGDVAIGNYVHIAPFCSLHGTGGGKIVMKDFSGLSAYCAVYAASDDYSGMYLTNPMIPVEYRNSEAAVITIEKHGLAGIRCTMLPGAYIAEGTALGACSLLSKPTEQWKIYAGTPARFIKERGKKMLEMENRFLDNVNAGGRVL